MENRPEPLEILDVDRLVETVLSVDVRHLLGRKRLLLEGEWTSGHLMHQEKHDSTQGQDDHEQSEDPTG